ncbi:MAG: MraY family glycosyltransferase [Collinsella sp.]|nr:MraY family glycosyltransferase [Collinsella sp.]
MEFAIPYICIAVASFLTTLVLTPLAQKIAVRLDAVDYPSKRRINTQPTPRLGGIAVFFGLVVASALQIFGTIEWGWPSALIPHPRMTVDYPLLGFSFLIIFLVGTIDDIFQLSPKTKLAGQILAAAIAAASGLLINVVVNPFSPGTEISLGLVSYPITVIYLVAYTNIINLIDGLDGLATGISAIAACSMFSFAILGGRGDAAALAIALIGSCLAFLRFNFHPAKIFLGDSGSLLLGFALGSISLLNVTRTAALTSLIIPLIVAGVPIIDTFSAIIRRMRAHVSIGQADKGHIHHRLIQEGYDQRQAVLLIYLWCILLNLGAAAINQVEVVWRIVIFALLLACSALFAMRLHLFEPVLRHHYNPKTHRDEIVAPDDPAFLEEELAQRRRREHPSHSMGRRRRDRDRR